MGMTMTEKILAKHAHRDSVSAGDLLVSQVDLVLANDITGPPAINEFEKIGKPVFDKDKIALVPDHFSPCKDIKSATMCKQMRDFARKHNITNYFEVGQMGIEHALLPDKGLVAPGEIVIGADSHTCTYGALRNARRTCRAPRTAVRRARTSADGRGRLERQLYGRRCKGQGRKRLALAICRDGIGILR